MHTVREFFDDVRTLRRMECRQHLLIPGVRLAHTHIVQNGAFDQMAVLKHEGNRVHQLVFINVLHIDPADGNTAALRIKEAGNERRQRGFSAAGGSDKRHRLSRADGKGNILHGIFGAVIAEGYLIQRHGAVLRMLRCARLRK